jgi:hypothetical protein
MYNAILLSVAMLTGQAPAPAGSAQVLPPLVVPAEKVVVINQADLTPVAPKTVATPVPGSIQIIHHQSGGSCASGNCGRTLPCTPGCNTCDKSSFLSRLFPCNTCKAEKPKCDTGCNGKDEKANGNGNGCEEKKEEEPEEGPWRLFKEPVAGFKITGWMYGTANYNGTNSGTTRYNGPLTMNDQEGFYLNQLWINANKALEKDCFGWGANLDVFFGNDYLASLSRGFENRRARGWLPHWWENQDYGIAIPQAYVDVGTSDYYLRIGHFYTPHGFMVVQAPNNFFNTLPYGFMMTNPFTHFGVQANANVTEQISVMGAIVNGWDALDRPVNSAAFMGGLKYSFKESKGFVSTNLITGQEPENLGPGYAARTLITNIVDYKPTDKWELVFENNLLWQRNRAGLGTDMSYSFIPYVFYKINDCWRAGLRYEYFHDPSGFISAERVGNPNNGPIISAGPYRGNMQSVSAGLNWAPNASKNLMIRPEVRYDWFQGAGVQPFNAGNDDHQIMFVLGAILQF